MATVGETLRRARHAQGISLEQAAEETRIRRSYLAALEADDAAALPAPVYTRGLLRTYATFLGLNADALVDDYRPMQRRERPPSLRPAVMHVPLPRQVPFRALISVLAVVVVAALIIFLWRLYQGVQRAAQEADTGPVHSVLPTLVVGQPTIAPSIVLTPLPSVIPGPAPSASPAAIAQPSPSPTPAPTGIVVEFQASASVYVEAAVDGKLVLAKTFAAGSKETLPQATHTVVLVASNPSALHITANGQPLDTSGTTAPTQYTWQR